jgi:hypothetical protein
MQLFYPITLTSLGLAALVPLMISLGIDSLSRNHPSKSIAVALEKRFSNATLSRPSFLAPEDMYVHWKLKESRHVFPHAANTGHIIRGLWADKGGIHAFRNPTNFTSYCRELQKSSIELVVLKEGSSINGCFSSSHQKWNLDKVLTPEKEIYNLWIRK